MDPTFARAKAVLKRAFGKDVLRFGGGVPMLHADFDSARQAAQHGRWDIVKHTLNKLVGLAEELESVRGHNRALGNELRRRFQAEATTGGYLGARAELSAAKLLVDLDLEVRRGEPPSFPDFGRGARSTAQRRTLSLLRTPLCSAA